MLLLLWVVFVQHYFFAYLVVAVVVAHFEGFYSCRHFVIEGINAFDLVYRSFCIFCHGLMKNNVNKKVAQLFYFVQIVRAGGLFPQGNGILAHVVLAKQVYKLQQV